MSHFSVLVIGDEVSEQLEPYRETKYNSQSKWDWFEEGGRWDDFFKLKDSDKRTFKARKKDIDFEGMRKKTTEDYIEAWKEHKEVVGDLKWESWNDVLARVGNIEESIEFYEEQEAIKKLKEAELYYEDRFLLPLEEGVKLYTDCVGVCFTFVKDGVWNEKGKMGWWGMSKDKVDQTTWNEMFNKILDELPDDTMLTVVDCHI